MEWDLTPLPFFTFFHWVIFYVCQGQEMYFFFKYTCYLLRPFCLYIPSIPSTKNALSLLIHLENLYWPFNSCLRYYLPLHISLPIVHLSISKLPSGLVWVLSFHLEYIIMTCCFTILSTNYIVIYLRQKTCLFYLHVSDSSTVPSTLLNVWQIFDKGSNELKNIWIPRIIGLRKNNLWKGYGRVNETKDWEGELGLKWAVVSIMTDSISHC